MSSERPQPGSSSDSLQPAPIVKGASLLIALRLATRPVLLIGGGAVASSRLYFLLESGAHITLISPPPLHPTITAYLRSNPSDITYYPREYSAVDDPIKVEDYVLVLTAIDDADLSRAVCAMCREKRVTVNVADVPDQCDFYFGAQFRRGDLQVLVSTGGKGPKVGVMIRDELEKALVAAGDVGGAIEGVGMLRRDLRTRVPESGGEMSKRRMEWMKATCDAWGMGAMVELRDEEVRRRLLDQGWEEEKVLGPREIGVGGGWKVPFRWGGSLTQSLVVLGLGVAAGMMLGRRR